MNEDQKKQLKNTILRLNNLAGLMLTMSEDTFNSLQRVGRYGGDAIFSKCFTQLEEADLHLSEACIRMQKVQRLCSCSPSETRRTV